jgi:hypothetical protein
MQKNKTYQKKILGTITTIALFFWWWNFAQTIDTEILIDWIDKIEDASTDRQKFDVMIDRFCSAIKNNNNAKQSLFVYQICKYKDANFFTYTDKWFSEEDKTSYIKFIENDEGKKINALDYELPWFYSNTEDYIEEVFDLILGSYTSIYQASIYGYATDPEKSIEENIHENFAKTYFSRSKKEGDYIKICSTENPKDDHPKTCKKLKEYFYWARNLLNSNSENYINDENIFKAYTKERNSYSKEKKEYCLETNSNRNSLTCGLYGNEIKYFIDLVYNELLFYALFVDYYSYLLQNKSDFKNWDIIEFQTKLTKNQKRVETMAMNFEKSREAIQTTIKILKELQYSFPIHIGFLLYSEDIYKFTNGMNKTLTPIYTLHDILRNVQKTD